MQTFVCVFSQGSIQIRFELRILTFSVVFDFFVALLPIPSIFLSLVSGFQNCALLWRGLWLFRWWSKSFLPVPVGTRSKTRPRRLRAGFWNARKCAQSPCKIFWAVVRPGGVEVWKFDFR